MSNSNIPPSPTPPWSRPIRNPIDETLTEDNDGYTISLERDTTYLRTSVAKDDASAYALTLPDGNYKGQYKTILVPGDIIATTQTWNVTGSFVLGTALIFDAVSISAQLRWDGSVWQLLGGNAAPLT